jgi:hypothetical protein
VAEGGAEGSRTGATLGSVGVRLASATGGDDGLIVAAGVPPEATRKAIAPSTTRAPAAVRTGTMRVERG